MKINLTKNQKQALLSSIPYFIFALIIAFSGLLILDILFPDPITQFNYTWGGIFKFLAICCGIGWVLHGVGFFIIKG